ncbi:2-C-methyl-D-erythritol 4-phosphate cytidylyltransferase [Pelagicoccus enzymogenes]|uniref:2-C-methyl-D-erythritol 4-phosphate cytidylyltransferase n=1 Tax=Pelagicoccus enzymogenes TaxID=2773457 RepID=UPI00280CF789|nr:2-C-methyl-D-erythritol 4-phosphate cytidylyltransferase [Pelagicoccus enzymogenes]MDQ8196897.1 2-C-methyl-D-erythritol 4-phosphate cytidylyltransferase [Pelagicoccus enzymogenes]
MPISTAILLAGGSGNRMQGQVEDKILANLGGKPVIAHSIDAFVSSGQLQHLVIVVRDATQQAEVEKVASALLNGPFSVTFTYGGAQRQDSVWAGLQAAPGDTEVVLIHDCARPCVTPAAIRESIAKAAQIGAACLARPVTDTIKSADAYDGAFLPTTVDRAKLWAMETPQSFQYSIIKDAYQSVIRSGAQITDDLSAIEDIDQPVAFVDNTRPNPKLTTPADLPYLEYLLQPLSSSSPSSSLVSPSD